MGTFEMLDHPPLKISFRVGLFPKRSETFVLNQIKGFIERGHEVSVLADDLSPEAANEPPPTWQAQLHSIDFLTPAGALSRKLYEKLPPSLRRMLRKQAERRMCARADVVICNFGWFGESVSASLTTENQTKIVTIFHGADMSRSLLDNSENPYRTLFKRGDLHLPISAFWRNQLIQLGAPIERIALQRMGVDLDQFVFTPRPSIVERTFRFITVCRLVEKKGIVYALEAMAALAQLPGAPDFSFEIFGDGPLNGELRQHSLRLGLENRVVFRGDVSHSTVAISMASADAFVLPSVVAADGDMEGIPVSLMEAMASGLPVISTYHSGIPELIRNEENGLLALERDVSALANALMRTMTDPVGRRDRAEAAVRTVDESFNMKKLHDQLERYVIALCEGKKDVRGLADEC